jgi:hypothetical protein
MYVKLDEPIDIYDFVNDKSVGLLLTLEDGSKLLVGDINDKTGVCDCCSYRYDKVMVVGYERIYDGNMGLVV